MTGARTHANEAQKSIEPARHPERELAHPHEPEFLQLAAPQAVYRRAQVNGNGLTAADLLVMQRTVGNRSVQRMLAQHTDSVNCQPQRAFGGENSRARVQSMGQPPDVGTRESMGARFGVDFSGVHMQMDAQAARSPVQVSVKACTVGQSSAKKVQRAPDPAAGDQAEKTEEFLRFVEHHQAEDAKITKPAEKANAADTMLRFMDWYDKNKNLPSFPKANLAHIYADLSVRVLKESIDKSIAKDLSVKKEAAENSPEVLKVRTAKFNEFYSLALQLLGYSSRSIPYRIPLDSEGKDILVTGDPALQKVLNALAGDQWAGLLGICLTAPTLRPIQRRFWSTC